MRILQINAVYGTKSTGRSCKEFHDCAVSLGHEVLTVYGQEPIAQVPDTEAIYLGSHLEHKIHAITGRIAGDAGIGSWRATNKLKKIIRDYNPDVVHLRNLHSNFVHIPNLLLFLAKTNIPTVVQTDDCFWFTGGCTHYTVNGCFRWQKDCSDCQCLPRGKNYLIKNNAAKALRRKKVLFSQIPRLAAIGVSKWTADQIRKSNALGNTPIIDFVYNWIDLNVFRPQGVEKDQLTRKKLRLTDGDKMIIGVASSWGISKGLDQFFKLRKILPINYRIYLIGNIDSSITLPDGIISLGSTESTEQLAELYSAADVFVHLSLEETFGKVTAEALACGTPAVVYNSTASPELVDHATGRVAAPGDISSVATAIDEIVNTPQMSSACRHRAQQLFDMTTNINKQLEIYKMLL